MNAAGDKLLTNDKGDSNIRCRKGGKAGPAATVKFGSASVPIYLSESKGRKRYFIAHYRDGKRIRKAFLDLAAAKKEALFVAQRIQSGMQHVTDLKPHERDNYAKAVELLGDHKSLSSVVKSTTSHPCDFRVRVQDSASSPARVFGIA